MTSGHGWRRYLRFVRPDPAADVDDEIAFHIKMRVERNIALGMSPEDASRDAIERFGDHAPVREELVHHDQRQQVRAERAEYVSDFMRDIKLGARSLRRAPGFTIAAALTLALGIGANSAIFSVVNAVVLQPLPYAQPDRLVAVGQGSMGEYLGLRDRLRTIVDLAAWVPQAHPVDDGRDALRLNGVAVTTNLMPMLGAAPLVGHGFTAHDGTPGNNDVVLISYGLWRRQFASAPDVVGRKISIEGLPCTIIGVMPPSFHYPSDDVEYWQPYAINPANLGLMWGVGGKRFIGRLAPDATIDRARREVHSVWPSLRRTNPLWDPGADYRVNATAAPLKADLVGGSASLLWLLFGSTLLVLLIACVNVANLLLARATSRERELAVRAALGGGRGRLVRQLVTEGLVLAVIGATAGIAIGWAIVRGLVANMPAGIPRGNEISMNGPVLAFTLGVAVVTGILFSLAPALRATSAGRSTSAGVGLGRRSTIGRSHARVSGVLVAAEVALAVLLVVASVLLVRSFVALGAIAPGFETTQIVAARISAPAGKYGAYSSRTPRLLAFYEDVLRRAQAIPGVRSAALVDQLPLAAPVNGVAVRVQGQFEDAKHTLPFIQHMQTVSPGYFAAMGIPLLRGRAFDDNDGADQPPVAIVSRSVARQFWPNGDAVGKRLGYPFDSPWLTVVGVVPDTKQDSLRDTSNVSIYMPWSQRSLLVGSELWLVTRTVGDPAAAGAAIRRLVAEIDRSVPVSDVRTMDAVVADSMSGSRFTMLLVGAFALLALTLGAVGIYGVMSYLVSERTREMGIRIALGASAAGVVGLVVGRAARLAVAGTIVGIAAALVATRFLRDWLYGVSPTDPVTFSVVPLLFLGVAVLASYAPARRATRADPAAALRAD